jgi:hypothetical protein
MSLNMTLTASFLPVLLELAAVIRKKGTMKPLLLPQRDPRLSHRQLVGQTAQHKPINHFNAQVCLNAVLKSLTTSSIRIASFAGSIC